MVCDPCFSFHRSLNLPILYILWKKRNKSQCWKFEILSFFSTHALSNFCNNMAGLENFRANVLKTIILGNGLTYDKGEEKGWKWVLATPAKRKFPTILPVTFIRVSPLGERPSSASYFTAISISFFYKLPIRASAEKWVPLLLRYFYDITKDA